jgi:hypothetical protein
MNNTNEKPTNQKESTLSPEIRKKAKELFDLIEEQLESTHPDIFNETVAEEWGDFLKESTGFQELLFSFKLAQTRYERAQYSIEKATWYMKDDALSDLHQLTKRAVEIVEIIEDDDSLFGLEWRMKEIKELGPDINSLFCSEWELRAKSYNEDIQKLQEAS